MSAARDREGTIEWLAECIAIESTEWSRVVGVTVARGQRPSPLNRYKGIWAVDDEITRPQRLATLTVEREDGLWIGGVADLRSPQEAASFVIQYGGVGQALIFTNDLSDVEDILQAQADSEISYQVGYQTYLFLPELVSREVPKRRKVARYWVDHEVSLDIFGLAGD